MKRFAILLKPVTVCHWQKYFSILFAVVLLNLFSFQMLRAADIDRSMWQNICQRSLTDFRSQTDRAFSRHFVPNGGLCGPTCLVNLAMTLRKIQSIKDRSPRFLMNQLARKFLELRKKQIGEGFWDTSMGELFVFLFTEFGFTSSDYRYNLKFWKKDDVSLLARPDGVHTASLLIVQAENHHTKTTKNAHWILILGHDPVSQRLYYSDPNFPKKERVLEYEFGTNGQLDIYSAELSYLLNDNTAAPLAGYHLRTSGGVVIELTAPEEETL